jgi:hypothetical protein
MAGDDLLLKWRRIAVELDWVEAAIDAARGPGPGYVALCERQRSLQRQLDQIAQQMAEALRAEAETEGSDDD